MVEWIVDTFRSNPELAIFLTLGAGYWLGGLKIGKFQLGSVTGVLLAGVLVGQMDISISAQVKSVFFIMFLFAVGYGVAVATQLAIFPFFGIRAPLGDHLLIGVLFTGVSLVRSYALRRVFDRWAAR